MSKSLYDTAPIAICTIRRDKTGGEILYANPALLHLMGVKESDVKGKTLEAIWPGKDTSDFLRKLKGVNPPHDYTLPIPSPTGPRWVKLTIQNTSFDGHDSAILWATDISATKKEQQKLEEAVAQADATAQMKSNFLATMSHEIRTPMQSVFGLLELIGAEKPEARIQSMVDIAQNSASGLLEILDDVLDLAKMDADKMDLDAFEVPVRTLVGGVLEAISVKVAGKPIKLLGEIDQSVPFVIIGDPKRLRQILINLIGNALKFTAKGSVIVSVTKKTKAISQPENGLALRFEISDTGIGMPEAVRKKLFQPFTQADNSTSRRFGGTGLGLSISKKLVELMGGQIGVDSVEGKGSTFWFEIQTKEVSTTATTVELPKLDGISILSVEDHPQGAKEIVRSLESMGAKVDSVPTIKEALDLVRRRPFDVGVVDQGLPDGLGLDLIREIMNIRPFMGLVMYTVRDDIGLQHSLNALGVDYLTKPASRRGLGEAILDAAQKISRMTIEGPRRLLIAEDTASVRDVLQRQLKKLGVEADFAEDGRQALEALKTGKYGILFTDLHMPEVDGYEVVETIRKQEEKTGEHFPVIVLTADVQMTQRETYMNSGFDECLLKPVSLGQLQRLLIRWGLMAETIEAASTNASATADENAAIDINLIKEQMGAFDASTIEMLHMFIDMTQPVIDSIHQAWEQRDFHGLSEAAHSLKGAARSACCNPLGDVASQLQDDAAAQKQTCGDLVAGIDREYKRACDAIRALKAP